MVMRISNYSIAPENYNKRTPGTLKKIADILLASILVIDPIILTIPDFAGKEWVLFGWNMAVALFKLISKLVTDINVYQN
jgi:hypothetical protein